MHRFTLSAASSPTRAGLSIALFLFGAMGAACSAPATKSPEGTPGAAVPSSASSSTATSAGAFEGAITAKMNAGMDGMEMTYLMKGPQTRIETKTGASGAPKAVVLMNLTSGAQTVLIPERKSYMTTDLKAFAEKMGKDAGVDAKSFKATTTGKTETIAGHKCQHWLIGEKQEADLCMAQGLGYFGGGGNGLLDQIKNLPFGDKNKEVLDANPEFANFVKGGAFPLKISQVEGGETKTIMEVTSIERKSLDDAIFSVPSDYKKIEMPKFPMGKQ